MNLNTQSYLRRRGMPEDVITALEGGAPVLIDADSLTSWLRSAYESGERVNRARLATALWPAIEVALRLARAEGYSEGYEENKQELLKAEAAADVLSEAMHAKEQRYKDLERNLEDFAAIAADVHCWLDGIALGARLTQTDWTRDNAWLPDPERARRLSMVLMALRAPEDDEIPF